MRCRTCCRFALSTTDAIGHAYGPDSREVHDQVLRVDRWLGAFFDELQRQVPFSRTVFVLTADHGVSSFPELTVVKTGKGGRVWLGDIATSVERELEARYRADFGLEFDNGLFYADVDAMRARRINVDSVASAVAALSLERRGVRAAFTPKSTDSAAVRWRRTLPPTQPWLAATAVQADYLWSPGKPTAEHGTPNANDLSIPVAFTGAGVAPGRYTRLARSVDIAPTLARLIGVSPIERLDGIVLAEVLGGRVRAAQK
jgi:arylsulfatase A-like enzyme